MELTSHEIGALLENADRIANALESINDRLGELGGMVEQLVQQQQKEKVG